VQPGTGEAAARRAEQHPARTRVERGVMTWTFESGALGRPQHRAAEMWATTVEGHDVTILELDHQGVAAIARGDGARLTARNRCSIRQRYLGCSMGGGIETCAQPFTCRDQHRSAAGQAEEPAPIKPFFVDRLTLEGAGPSAP
jgi:hypothetical protein